MLRGTVTLTAAQLQQLHATLSDEQISDPLLLEKVTLVSEANPVGEVMLELSKEEAELILDVMPTPQTEEPESLTQARTKIRLFVVGLSAHA